MENGRIRMIDSMRYVLKVDVAKGTPRPFREGTYRCGMYAVSRSSSSGCLVH